MATFDLRIYKFEYVNVAGELEKTSRCEICKRGSKFPSGKNFINGNFGVVDDYVVRHNTTIKDSFDISSTDTYHLVYKLDDILDNIKNNIQDEALKQRYQQVIQSLASVANTLDEMETDEEACEWSGTPSKYSLEERNAAFAKVVKAFEVYDALPDVVVSTEESTVYGAKSLLRLNSIGRVFVHHGDDYDAPYTEFSPSEYIEYLRKRNASRTM